MYYIMSQQGQRIIETSFSCPTQEQLAQLAQECYVDLYVIQGEHSGITYTRPIPDEDELAREAQSQRDEDESNYQAMVLRGLGRP